MHILSARQFDLQTIGRIFDRAAFMERVLSKGGTRDYEGKILALLFFGPSMRTRFSFEAAMLRLGGRTISTDNASVFSSEITGSSIEDTVRAVESLCDAIVIRHNEVGASLAASKISEVPIINGGETSGEHPTQALLDLYTIYKERGHLEGLKVAFVGDILNGRTIKSLAYFLAKYARTVIYFVNPPLFGPDNSTLLYLDRMNTSYFLLNSLKDIPDDTDVIYVTRLHKELFQDRVDDYYKYLRELTLSQELMKRFNKAPTVMHPLPRGPELPREIDALSNAAYFRQNKNGLPIRMALLSMLYDGDL